MFAQPQKSRADRVIRPQGERQMRSDFAPLLLHPALELLLAQRARIQLRQPSRRAPEVTSGRLATELLGGEPTLAADRSQEIVDHGVRGSKGRPFRAEQVAVGVAQEHGIGAAVAADWPVEAAV